MKFTHPALALTLSLALAPAVLLPLTPRLALARDNGPVAPGKYEDWHDLDEAEIVQGFRLADYKTIVIAPVDTKGADLPDKDDNTYAPILKVLANITDTFTEGVREKAPGGIAVTRGNGGGAGVLVIRAKVASINPGSAAARHFGGLAGKIAAAARVSLAGEVVDGKTNKTLFRFRTGHGSSGGMFGGDYVKLLNNSAKEVGNDVAGALRAF